MSIAKFDNENKPDYLGFHLGEDFDKWFDEQKQKIVFESVNDISIATDGISMFTQVSKNKSGEIIEPINYLLINKDGTENEDMLTKRIKRMENEFGLKHTDDLAIIRLINQTF